MKTEDTITYLNASEHYRTPPTGFLFSAKELTEKAKGRLKGYWTQTANINDKKREMEEIRAEGNRPTESDYNWLSRYNQGQCGCFDYLRHNGFLKIDKTKK